MHRSLLLPLSLVSIGLLSGLLGSVTAQAAPKAPVCNQQTRDGFSPELVWTPPPSQVTQYQLQVTPSGGDGPALDLIRSDTGKAFYTSFRVPAPPAWYGLLPDMTYTWRVRYTDATVSVGPDDASWGEWSANCKFRTPAISSAVITPQEPALGQVGFTLTPTLHWSRSHDALFYYEVQLSKDDEFNTDPATATAAVYSNLIHGGASTPVNRYTVPANAPLEAATFYYWRVRPRVQGDGTSVAWSPTWRFGTIGAKAEPPPAPGPSGMPLTELVTNGDFEQGSIGWQQSGCVCLLEGEIADTWHSGTHGAYLRPNDGNDRGEVAQSVVIPASATRALLSYWWQFGSTQSFPPVDCFEVGAFADNELTVLQHTCVSVAPNEFVQTVIDVTRYRGKSLKLSFSLSTQYTFVHPTTAYLDDVSLAFE